MSRDNSHHSSTLCIKTGKEIAATFLKDYKPFFPTIIGTTRDKGSEAAKALAAVGADIREVPDDDNEEEALSKVFQGVDVVVDTLGSPAAKTKNLVIKAVAKAGVSVFIPSEFGMCAIFCINRHCDD